MGGFDEYHFIDINRRKLDHLRELVGDRNDVHFHEGDCNEILVSEIFPLIRFDTYRRAFCLLDPYGLQLRWEVFREAAAMETIEILLNFSIMDLNRNIGLRDPSRIRPEDAARATATTGGVRPSTRRTWSSLTCSALRRRRQTRPSRRPSAGGSGTAQVSPMSRTRT